MHTGRDVSWLTMEQFLLGGLITVYGSFPKQEHKQNMKVESHHITFLLAQHIVKASWEKIKMLNTTLAHLAQIIFFTSYSQSFR